MNRMTKKLKSRRVKEIHYLDVEQVEVNHSVYVKNISNKKFANKKSALESYFKSKAGLNCITILSTTKAMVTFKDPSGMQVVKEIGNSCTCICNSDIKSAKQET